MNNELNPCPYAVADRSLTASSAALIGVENGKFLVQIAAYP